MPSAALQPRQHAVFVGVVEAASCADQQEGEDDEQGLEMTRQELQRAIGCGAMGSGLAIAIGAVTGLVIGILVSVATDVLLAPEAGLLLGLGAGWLASRRDAA